MSEFKLISPYKPLGDQPKAIKSISEGFNKGLKHQTLLGVTGSGKTFTMANVVKEVKKPTLVISHNKTLAAQLYEEFKEFFPDNAVEYFVSYYDYYQPEAYIAQSDTYIDKEAQINDEIDMMRHSTTQSLLTRDDVIVVSSVSCIYGIGSPEDYGGLILSVEVGDSDGREKIIRTLIDMQYERNDIDFTRGKFRVRGDVVEIRPAQGNIGIRIELFGDEVDRISLIDPLLGSVKRDMDRVVVFPAKHFVTSKDKIESAITNIEKELEERLTVLHSQNKLVEAQRLEQRTRFDMEMLQEVGYCTGIENYSMHLSGRKWGETPITLMQYFPDDFLTIIDESHVTVPQIGGMYAGDRARKDSLVDHGFRLPSARENRPLNFSEFEMIQNQVLYVSATPAKYELGISQNMVEQIIRPTGLVDPEIIVKPVVGQVDHLLGAIKAKVEKDQRVLVTTLTKKMAEDLTDYYAKVGIKVRYLHSDITTLERIDIIDELRRGSFDCLVGVNLLREGLDLPEVALVGILDADKEGFLRSKTSLIQTIGRAARNVEGQVIIYADKITDSISSAVEITNERRKLQMAYNKENGINPKSTVRSVKEKTKKDTKIRDNVKDIPKDELLLLIKDLEADMKKASQKLDFETAAKIRDKIQFLEGASPDEY
ncbi:UvrABC system protein B [Methanobacterium lacus]|uniref:UvrABC system protein B n=1 Tax=Methanobacterium lacus (strain AL-21) TaxID=877455 RepID=F0T5V6_METLA|nr:excinuclease ABC subunit UvrB [Methanobacterium lacus]ADZ09349.1 UvrABC system protein B [Methanobacterium lacus]